MALTDHLKVWAEPGPCSYGGPCYWHCWEVSTPTGHASGKTTSHRRAQRQARKALRRLRRDGA